MSVHESQLPPPRSTRNPLPPITVEAAARSFYKQAVGYGFSLSDFVSFTNTLLGIAMAPRDLEGIPSEGPASEGPRSERARYRHFPLVGEKVSIRPFGERDDRALLERWVDDEQGRFFLFSTASGQTLQVDDVLLRARKLLGMVMFEGRAVGAIAFLDHSPDQRRAELRKIIGERQLRGRGLGREASRLWVGYGLGALGLKKIYLNTLSTHIGNIKINEEIGFQVEGILRNEVLIDGTYRDVLRMGLWHE
jgi:RimJ/RimL family protein N-acetyltransferase